MELFTSVTPTVVSLTFATIFQVSASLWYLSTIYRHETVLNPASWGLWSVLTILNTITYFFTSDAPIIALIPALSALSTTAVFISSLLLHARVPLDWLDESAIIIGILSAGVWVGSGSAALASVTLQVAFMIGFLPTFRSLIKKTSHEPLGPWILWVIAYLFTMAAVTQSGAGSAAEYAYPFMATTLHAAVVSIAAGILIGGKLAKVKTTTIKAVGI